MYVREKTVTFIGHSICDSVDAEKLERDIETLIRRGFDRFLCGGMGAFDSKCAFLVRKLQGRYPHVRSCLVLPYLTFSYVREDYDETMYPEGLERYHFKAAIFARNRYMVSHSRIAICYVNHSWGGAAKTYAYVKKQGLHIINLGIVQ